MSDEYDHSYWIGIDWGTTNCTAAIYCPTLGRSKWMRLSLLRPFRNNETPHITIHNVAMEQNSSQQQQQSNHKVGRIIPSVLLFATTQFLDEYCCGCTDDHPEWHDDSHIRMVRLQQRHQPLLASSRKTDYNYYIWENVTDLLLPQNNNATDLWVCVGAAAESFRNELLLSVSSISEEMVDRAIITSAKRTILKELSTTTSNYSNKSCHTNIVIPVHPLGCINQNDDDDHTERQCCCQLDAITVVAILLRSIRRAAHNYLQQPKVQKKLGVGDSLIKFKSTTPLYSCCIGVPVMASYQYRTLLQHAATRAGYQTTITCTESTAAAMAYGLSFVVHTRTTPFTTEDSPSLTISHQQLEKRTLPVQTIFVFDMGGGTTDVTIAERSAVSATSLNDDVVEDDDIDFQVCVTVGNDQLGGDDMDQAILNLVQTKIHDQGRLNQTTIDTLTIDNSTTPLPKQQQLLRQCRLAKLALCGDIDHDIHPLDSYVIPLQDDASTHIKSVTISQKDFELAMVPIVQSTRDLIQSALDQYEIKRDTKLPKTLHDPQSNNLQKDGAAAGTSFTTRHIDEVILIGGASRVPYIRHLLRDIFIANSTASSVKELCTSINAMSAVAQGCSVSAVIYSGRVPIHEIKSAFMLDTIPYSIGVLTTTTTLGDNRSDSQMLIEPRSNHSDNIIDGRQYEENNFIEILSRGTPLPAAGYSTFVLSDMLQKGITVIAVEQIPISTSSSSRNERKKNDRESKKQNGINVPRYQYNILGEFTFLLHRLSKDQIHRLRDHENGIRTVDVGMTLKESGEFVVSIFDQNDPDHIRKKQRYQRNKAANEGRTPDRMMHRSTSPKITKRDPDDGATDMDEFEPNHPYTFEQMVLMVSCALVFVLYIATKLTFPTTIAMVGPSDA